MLKSPQYQFFQMLIDKKTLKSSEATILLAAYSKNPELANSKCFFQKYKPSTVQQLARMVFEYYPRCDIRHDRNVTTAIDMMKKGLGFLEYVLEHEGFPREAVFGFLGRGQVDESLLMTFSNIFTALARQAPSKVMEIIRHEDVQNLLITNLKRNEVLTVIYTAIFCLNKAESTHFRKFTVSVLRVLLHAPFQDQQGLTVFNNCECKEGSSIVTSEEDNQQPKQNKDNEMEAKSSLLCQKGCENLQHAFFNVSNQDFYENMVESIDNLRIMLEDVSTNLEKIELANVDILINIILENCYIKQLFILLLLNERTRREGAEPLNAQILRLIHEIVILFKKYSHMCNNMKQLSVPANSYLQPSLRERRNSIEKMLFSPDSLHSLHEPKPKKRKNSFVQVHQTKFLKICQQVSCYLCIYSRESAEIVHQKDSMAHSMGLNIQKVSMSSLWILKLHEQLLEAIEFTNFDDQKKYQLKSALPSLLPLIQECMAMSKWNNIIQRLIVKVTRQYLRVCYGKFYHSAINIDKISHGFLGFLIEAFRNRYYIFLDSMKFISQGDRHTIFEISRDISAELHSNKDLFWLFGKFPEWKTFMENDLQVYEQTCHDNKYFEESMLKNSDPLIPAEPLEADPNSSLEQIIEDYKDAWKCWHMPCRALRLATHKSIPIEEEDAMTEADNNESSVKSIGDQFNSL